ncbi:transcriptional regulator [Klebsiella sp. RIT-PI-d]|uniref:MerR family transcriptional regulator n=1 Tax=Klebsiella sp. RIT-PI-d TaxID=1681196 RepID=UPI000676302B|nr:MerR family transcriptional regulator [Klebsiella sp. RIT-PI-d]KNC09106.1 transcriptional regulator [Klebsiella sp. RIT-PI-d]
MKELDIRHVADLTGITPSALRYYEKKGLIKPVGRNGLRRQYNENVINKLQLISLGQAAGFSLSEIATMFSSEGALSLDRLQLLQRAKETDDTIRKLRLLSRGLKHVACCTKTEHSGCEEFNRIVSKGLRLIR